MAPQGPSPTNFGVDYVIQYRVPPSEKTAATVQFKQLVRALASVGLKTEVRHADETSLFIFVTAADEGVFADVVYRSRIRDWLHGVTQVQPNRDVAAALKAEPLSEAERYRQVHHMITCPKSEGGAEITPKTGEWTNVVAIFPLHDHAKNKKWLEDISSKTFLTPEDLDNIRNTVGERIGYYYAFLQTYFTFLAFPAVFGFSCWVLLGQFSAIYAVVNGLWCVVFVEWWKRQETELAIRWGVKNVSSIEDKRKGFIPQKTVKDPITGEEISYFPAQTRLLRQMLQIPFALVSVVALGCVIVTCYGIEIFISEVYDGPFKSYLAFSPTILLTLIIPTVSSYLTDFALRLTEYENYETQESHDKAMVSKIFVLNFITSYLGVFLTAFVYVPFATILVPYLDVFNLTVKPLAGKESDLKAPNPVKFSINRNRLRGQMVYCAVTAQIVNFVLETVLPLVMQKGTSKYKQMQSRRAEKAGGAAPSVASNDHPEEKEFLERVREEALLPEYEVTNDLREMVVQFGYLSLFSVIWPLTPVAYFVNNWVELRGDTFKLTMESKRPSPQRADSIGPWLNSLEFLGWLGSITAAALVYLFSNDGLGPDGRPSSIKGWALLLSVFLSEHIYLLVQVAVRTAIGQLDGPNLRKERSERFMVRKQYLEEAGLGDVLKQVVSAASSPLLEKGDSIAEITRQSLEEDARESSLKESNPNTRFWARQKGWSETETVGLSMIDMMDVGENETKKSQ